MLFKIQIKLNTFDFLYSDEYLKIRFWLQKQAVQKRLKFINTSNKKTSKA